MSRKKKRKGSGFFSNLLLLLCIVVFCVAAWKLWGYYNNYHGGRKEYEQLRQYVKEKKDSDKKRKKKSGPDTCPVQVDFDALARINPDVKAWIYIKGTGINTSYNADADYKDHQKIWIITPQEEIEYQVFAAREIDVNVDADVYTIEFATEEDYADYLKTAVEKSLYHLGTKTDSTENMLTLSTCTSSSEAGRFIVQAMQIQRTAKE